MKKEDGRLRGMDGLRGVAIIAITLFHMFPSVFRRQEPFCASRGLRRAGDTPFCRREGNRDV